MRLQIERADIIGFLALDRVWVMGFGALHQWSENLRIGYSFNWADLGRAPLDTDFVKGRYKDNDIYLFNVSFQMKNLPWAGALSF